MSTEKNILSDPTSDGNVSTTNEISGGPSSPVYSYEEFDNRVNLHGSDQGSLTQTCPTCGGSGKLTKGKLHLIRIFLIIMKHFKLHNN